MLTSFEQTSAIHEKVKGVFFWELDTFSDDVIKVVSSKIVGNEVPKIKGD
jgi:hypothetical protein